MIKLCESCIHLVCDTKQQVDSTFFINVIFNCEVDNDNFDHLEYEDQYKYLFGKCKNYHKDTLKYNKLILKAEKEFKQNYINFCEDEYTSKMFKKIRSDYLELYKVLKEYLHNKD